VSFLLFIQHPVKCKLIWLLCCRKVGLHSTVQLRLVTWRWLSYWWRVVPAQKMKLRKHLVTYPSIMLEAVWKKNPAILFSVY